MEDKLMSIVNSTLEESKELSKIDQSQYVQYEKMYYKKLKEDIVTGFSGSNKFDVFLIVFYLPVILNHLDLCL